MWLSHSLEALYDTPAALIGKFLQDRILQVLPAPAQRSKQLRGGLRDFYELRSRFVHGSLPTQHPMSNDIIDPAVDEVMRRLNDAIWFGARVAVATLQKLIREDWTELAFAEKYGGVQLLGSTPDS